MTTKHLAAAAALAALLLGGCGSSTSGQVDRSAATSGGSSTSASPAAQQSETPQGSAAECPPADGAKERVTTFTAPPPMCIDPAKTYTATVKTDVGQFTIDLDAKKAPKTVNNFVVLARHKYYDGIVFASSPGS